MKIGVRQALGLGCGRSQYRQDAAARNLSLDLAEAGDERSGCNACLQLSEGYRDELSRRACDEVPEAKGCWKNIGRPDCHDTQ